LPSARRIFPSAQDNQRLAREQYTKNWETTIRDETEKAMKEDQFKEISELRQQALNGENPQAKAHYGKLEKAFIDTLTTMTAAEPKTISRLAMSYLNQKEQLADYQKKNEGRAGEIQETARSHPAGQRQANDDRPWVAKTGERDAEAF
jgi:hypothetical protein